MVIESSQQPVKRGRGRPRKTPLPVKQKAESKESKKDVKKVSKIAHSVSSLSWEEELAAFEKRSNKSGALTLLILLLGIALIGYGMYLKLHQADTIDDDMPTSQVITTPTTGQHTTTPAATTPTTSSSIVQDYFSYVNNGQLDKLSTYQDSSFRTLPTLRNYFNNTRLETFAKNTIGGIRIEGVTENTTDPVLQRNPALHTKAYDFTMKYTLKSDEKEYHDLWRVYTVQKGTGTVINGFVYQGTGLSQSPFFQFTKFNIK